MKTIRSNVFKGCKGLETLILGNSVETIGENVFEECSGLTSIFSLNTTPPSLINRFVFYWYTYDDATLYVPESAISDYKDTDPWKEFKKVAAIETTGINSITSENGRKSAKTYTINGAAVTDGYKGIVIKNRKKVLSQ